MLTNRKIKRAAKKGTKPLEKPPLFDHKKTTETRLKTVNGEIVLDLPQESVSSDDLPFVTIITVTENRPGLVPFAIDNWGRFGYPRNKLLWLIVDSSTVKDPQFLQLEKDDPQVMYHYIPPRDGGYTIGYKRNLGVELSKTDYIVMMDDDDFLYNESILARISILLFYKKGCVYSNTIGVYNLIHESSFVMEDTPDIPECSMAFTRKFWEEKKFDEEAKTGEGLAMVIGREDQMIKCPYFFNVVLLNHSKNITGKKRNFKVDRTGQTKRMLSMKASLNLFKNFSPSFRSLIKEGRWMQK